MEISVLSYYQEEIEAVARKILGSVTSKTILFNGEMGVGKTTLIKELAKQLGSMANVSSPTFSIVNEYEISDGLLYHFDLYRIKNEEEAINFGIEEYLFSNEWIFIEWPEKLGALLPEEYNTITITLNSNKSRKLSVNIEKFKDKLVN